MAAIPLLLTSLALALPRPTDLPLLHDDLHALLPVITDSASDVSAWESDGASRLSPVRAWIGGGTRIGLIAEADGALAIEARGVDAEGQPGPWVRLEEAWAEGTTRVASADLGGWWPAAQLRIGAAGAGVTRMGWELLIPLEERGEPLAESVPPPLSSGLQALGVVSRSEWGAEPTQCTSTEDDWYRFAIHHTAGTQTYGGTVEGAVRALQAYAFGTGEYCDIPYQFLVGYDGSLYEGRSLTYTSGATGGGNNDGNIAVCFLGCYSGSPCGSLSNDDTDVMIVAARALVDQLAADQRTTVTEDSLRGHRDWPDNSTNCPGDYVYARLDEVREPEAPYTGTLVAWGFDGDDGSGLRIPLGAEVPVWVDVRNDGTRDWEPGSPGASGTFLAPIPRDTGTAYAGSGWPSSTRTATVPGVVAPGQTARFTFNLRGEALGPASVSFGMVAEWVTWFGDLPYGGGPEDGAVTIAFEVVEPPADTGNGGGSGGGDNGGGGGPGNGDTSGPDLPGAPLSLLGGGACGCGTGSSPAAAALALAALLAARRRAHP